MPTNGELNGRGMGVYRSLCCNHEIVIGPGATFPDCPKHPNLITEWQAAPDETILNVSQLPDDARGGNTK
jgi:hypothetical protein